MNEAEMDYIDERTSAMLRVRSREDRTILRHFARAYGELMVAMRTALVLSKLGREFRWDRLLFLPGLGNDAETLMSQGGEDLSLFPIGGKGFSARSGPCQRMFRFSRRIVRRLLGKVSAFGNLVRPKTFPLVTRNGEGYLFLTGIRRVLLRDDIECADIHYWPFRYVVPGKSNSEQALLRRFLSKLPDGIVPATSIHGYTPILQQLEPTLLIFPDGYIPSNFPRSYIDFMSNGTFVCRDTSDARWFRAAGRVFQYPCSPVMYPVMPPMTQRPVKEVVLVLNHAGDWTALIHRSDTDILIQVFCELASEFPEMSFVIRPHPSMVHPSHEGPLSRCRIVDYVHSMNRGNLRVSERSLDEDLAAGDLFVSEYSNVLYEAFLLGRPGIIAHFVQRRSFMADFTALGFHTATDRQQFAKLVKKAVREPDEFARSQNAAAEKFNREFTHFFSDV